MVNYHSPKGQRYKKGTIKGKDGRRRHIFIGLQVDDCWWCKNKKQWVKDINKCADNDDVSISSTTNCHSVKAAVRHLKNHSEIPKGTKVTLVSRFIGIPNIVLTKR